MPILHMSPGDLLELKKPHPCGTSRFLVLRTGSEVRIRCAGCGRDMTFDRLKLEKAVRRVLPSEMPSDESGDRS